MFENVWALLGWAILFRVLLSLLAMTRGWKKAPWITWICLELTSFSIAFMGGFISSPYPEVSTNFNTIAILLGWLDVCLLILMAIFKPPSQWKRNLKAIPSET